MLKDFDWGLLGPGPVMSLSAHELLLIDWIICPASGLIPGAEPEQLVKGWEGIRNAVWQVLSGADLSKDARYPLPMNELDAQFLFGVAPSTFRWGTGPDCGFSLKRRLYLFLKGITPTEDLPKQEEVPVTPPSE
jgi:hypothetical protein